MFRVMFMTRLKTRFKLWVSRFSSFLARVVMWVNSAFESTRSNRVDSVNIQSTRVNTVKPVNSSQRNCPGSDLWLGS
ncbi:hypothetical protein Hanom_Chr16g01457931 [Helianthus anomalus]